MDDELFNQLLKSVKQAKQIMAGTSNTPYWKTIYSETVVQVYSLRDKEIGRIVEYLGMYSAIFYHPDGIESVHPFGYSTQAREYIEQNYRTYYEQ